MGIPLETCNRMFKGIFLVAVFGITFAAAQREGKFFSLFNVVSFKNDDCVSTSTSLTNGNRNGTCYTSSECTDKGGTASGGCAMGFGTCCLFTEETCGSTVSENQTYVRNENFPTGLTGTTSTTLDACTFSVEKCADDVTTIRLDFETFEIQSSTFVAQTATIDTLAICQDSFSVTSTNRPAMPVICGTNTGEHMFFDVGADTSATIGFTYGTNIAGTRTFEIKITQYTIDSPMRPPEGCLQYFIGTEGRIRSFNYGENKLHLPDQDYSICIRQEKGFGCNTYTPCMDTTGELSFSLFNAAIALQDIGCTRDYIEIAGSSEICGGVATFSKYCGAVLSSNPAGAAATGSSVICDCSLPFVVGIKTDGSADGDDTVATTQSRGVCLDYVQKPFP